MFPEEAQCKFAGWMCAKLTDGVASAGRGLIEWWELDSVFRRPQHRGRQGSERQVRSSKTIATEKWTTIAEAGAYQIECVRNYREASVDVLLRHFEAMKEESK
jgi:hypothetical protein